MRTATSEPTWALDHSHVWHVTCSNLPVGCWSPGRTFCLVDGALSRTDRQPARRGHRVCPVCVSELVFMGERVPEWMRRVAR